MRGSDRHIVDTVASLLQFMAHRQGMRTRREGRKTEGRRERKEREEKKEKSKKENS